MIGDEFIYLLAIALSRFWVYGQRDIALSQLTISIVHWVDVRKPNKKQRVRAIVLPTPLPDHHCKIEKVK